MNIQPREPLISICIPTYNRSVYLKECLDSIGNQFDITDISKKIEIVVSDNHSKDNTEEIIRNYQRKYSNISYYRNSKNIGPVKNIIKAASYARGDYIWFFSDDDVQYKNALKTLIQTINSNKPEVLFCNVALYSKDVKKLLEDDLLLVKKDIFLKNKKELFSFLETKFFLAIDWYTTFLSNVLFNKKIFGETYKKLDSMDEKKYLFPHTAFIHYNARDLSTYIISKTLIKYRTENIVPKVNSIEEYLAYVYKIMRTNDFHIYKINRKNISLKFLFLLIVKHTLRYFRLQILKLFHIDISRILIRIYTGKYPLKINYFG